MKKKTKPVRRKSKNPPVKPVSQVKTEIIPVFIEHRFLPGMIREITRLMELDIDRIAITNGNRIFHFETEKSYTLNRDAPASVDGSSIGSEEDTQ